ncbi:MbcA/ParS/Xre antitoxin family protein [Xenophilus arseniciresistens]|uniref:MbcA/ParS/Xre antitoxin family protein n=1 Tax=Xenophilus arseniciresistens TaxID=1283306 RepID=A0AAE3T1V4_9BURK|nr:MbcA/ParS/Xre antitoxin family protein [Xenophilus arseniciresistens]MDA7418356.1 MbcA/ParS/Xre antitoxin family protein [Xenophilus arseniciresistens]
MSALSSSFALSDIEAEIRRLTREREALQEQRQKLRVEELKTLADAYARKLQAAGFSVAEGLAALRPYASVRLQAAPDAGAAPAASAAPAAPAPAAASPAASAQPPQRAALSLGLDALHNRAAQVLGDDAHRWLRRAHSLLGGQTPLQLASTPQGLERVHALLAAYARGA